jgi:DNA-binding PadR family transcriptional regulator
LQAGLEAKRSGVFLNRPHGAPRGFLVHYVLHRISRGPCHGYEILQDIESKTEGSWRPGAGSVYPVLKKLLQQGYVQVDVHKRGELSQRVYSITPKGERQLEEMREVFRTAAKKWGSFRRLFIDMIETEDLYDFFLSSSKSHFEISRELIESKIPTLDRARIEFMLKEYEINLEEQLEWTREKLRSLRSSERGRGNNR